MGYFAKRTLRGSLLEDMLNRTNEAYMADDLAVMQKVPTPIKPVEIDSGKGVITLAYFDEKSTVDYVGNVQGIPVCFDAKETGGKSLPLENIREHQLLFMRKFTMQGGIAFILADFTDVDRYFALDYFTLQKFCDEAAAGGRKSVPLAAFDGCPEIKRHGRYLVHYLEVIEKLLEINASHKV